MSDKTKYEEWLEKATGYQRRGCKFHYVGKQRRYSLALAVRDQDAPEPTYYMGSGATLDEAFESAFSDLWLWGPESHQ